LERGELERGVSMYGTERGLKRKKRHLKVDKRRSVDTRRGEHLEAILQEIIFLIFRIS